MGVRSKAQNFYTQLTLYIAARPEDFPPGDDESRLVCAVGLLRGGAAATWADLLNKFYHKRYRFPISWADFLIEFEKRFIDPNPEITAHTKMTALTYASCESTEDFLATFESLEDLTGDNDITLFRLLFRKIPKRFRDSLMMAKPMPRNLVELKEAVRELDAQYQLAAALMADVTPRSAPRAPPHAPAPRSVQPSAPSPSPAPAPPPLAPAPRRQPDVVPMEVDASRRRPRGGCFNCGELGHRAAQCPAEQRIIRAAELEDLEERVEAIYAGMLATPVLSPAPPAPTPSPPSPAPSTEDFQNGP